MIFNHKEMMIKKLANMRTGLFLVFVMVFYAPVYATITPWYQDILPQESLALIQNNQNNPNFVILDVRTPGEILQGRIKNSTPLDFLASTFPADLEKLDKNKTYLLYCRSGNRSGKALEIMKGLKFQKVFNMTGGIQDWYNQGLPIK